jgi:DNA-binding transcriptional ArsR family regulator
MDWMSEQHLKEEELLPQECDIEYVNEEVVKSLKAQLIDENKINHLAELFKAFSDPTRLKIIHALKQSELCVCDLSAVLSMGQSAVSHQLRYLRNLRLVKRRKEGKMMYYTLDDQHIEELFVQGLSHIDHK